MTSLEQMADLSASGWSLLGAFALALVAGIALGVHALAGPSDRRAREILAERLARGEISPEEHRERLSSLGPERGRRLSSLAVALVAAGLVGVITVAAIGPGGGFTHSMMGGRMGSMMGGGETGRSGSPPASGAPEIRISAREFSFDPTSISIRAGQTVNVVFENRGHMFHTLTAGDLGLDLRANDGDSIAGALTPPHSGRFDFICSVPGHAQAGMRGTIVVAG